LPASLYARLEALANRRIIAVLMVIFLILFLVVFPLLYTQISTTPDRSDLIDTQASYSPAQVYALIGSYGEQGRSMYILTDLTADLLYPLDYALLFALLIIATYRQANSRA
jgi:hypothetical protein